MSRSRYGKGLKKNKRRQESEFLPMGMSVPSDSPSYNTYRSAWYGINRGDIEADSEYGEEINTGYFSKARNISVEDSPILRTARSWKLKTKFTRAAADGGEVVSVSVIRNLLVVVQLLYGMADTTSLLVTLCSTENWSKRTQVTVTTESDFASAEIRRSVIQFNRYQATEGEISGTYEQMILIFPDCISIPIAAAEAALQSGSSNFEGAENFRRKDGKIRCPDLLYAVAHQGRIFGVSGPMVYVSAYNDYTDWDVDTAEDIDSQNAWCSSTQANIKATDDFTGLANYNNNVIAFKRTYTQRIANSKNPFRVVDVTEDGAIDDRSIQTVGGSLVYVSGKNVMLYTGGTPKEVGTPLGIRRYSDGIAGGWKDTYYLSRGDEIYTLDLCNGLWGVLDAPVPNVEDYPDGTIEHGQTEIFAFAGSDDHFYCMVRADYGNGVVTNEVFYLYELSDSRAGEWYAETVLTTRISTTYNLDPKRLRSAQLACRVVEGAEVSAYLLCDDESFDPNAPEGAQLLFASGGRSGDLVLRAFIRKSSGTGYRIALVGKGDVVCNAMAIQISYGRGNAYNAKE